MPDYRRARHPGGTYFFTLTLLRRHDNDLLTRHIQHLREAVRVVRRTHPFDIHGWVVLPDHLHCVVQLPEGDFITNLARLRVSFSFTTRSFLQALVQCNDRADLWSMNLRFGWLQAANTGLFIVYNDTRYLYDLTPQPERTDRSLVIKFSRTFDLLR